jgi:hypothetical protein
MSLVKIMSGCNCRLALVCLAISGSLVGCGNNLAQVAGYVTVDGEPLRGGPDVKATVYFQPSAGGAPAVGIVDGEGKYNLSTGSQQGVAPGEYLVTCSASQIIASPTGGTPGGKRVTDPKYASTQTSGLRFSVQEGPNQYDIALESQKSFVRKP